ncbi:hybrid sensor histidine kinase/response regulator [Gemmatimonas groenlandica]|uniref:histidine kinase n=1 Tax=Gemmatimonas groenlandica TaxID=2732249 RepID=A0A6M4IVR7_9BACT|nr:response regulator [Gemmatimonas groenlandica]QJR36271.1 response regulator [Gemmatimonas groenlandica]
MDASLFIAIVSLTLQFSTTVAMIVIARAPGWQRVRWFALVACSAGLYSLSDALGMVAPEQNSWWITRVNITLATIHTAGWVAYTYADRAGSWRSLSGRLRWWMIGGVLAATVVSVLGLTDHTELAARDILGRGGSAGGPILTPIGQSVVFIPLISILLSAVGQVGRARAGEEGAASVVVGFFFFTLFAVEEALVAAGMLDFIYLADLGYICVTLPVTMQLLRRFTRDAQRLDTLSTHLAEEVARRTQERDEARVNLIEQQRLASLGRLAAGVGHEINNPLQYLRFSLDELRESPIMASHEALRETLAHAFDGTERIRKVVDDLRTYVRPSDDALELLDVRDIVRTALRIGSPQWRHSVHVETRFDDAPHVRGDEGKLVQVVLNPLVNGAQSVLQAAESRTGVLCVSTRTGSDGWAEIEIADEGGGFEPDILSRLGEPYVTTKASRGGTGLGLFVSRGIVEAHGGTMHFRNAARSDGESAGAVVLIRLPAVSPRHATGRTPISTPLFVSDAHAPPLRVLMVEDDRAILSALTRGLEREGLLVHGVHSAAAALEWLEQDQPDVVVSDLMMPGMSGAEFANALAARHPALRRRLVIMTGGATTPDLEQFLADPSLMVLGKPIARQFLAEQLRKRAAASA